MHAALIRHLRAVQRLRRKPRGGGPLVLIRVALITMLAIVFTQLALAFVGLSAVAGVYTFFAQDLPPIEEVERRNAEAFKTTRLYDRTGQTVLYEIIGEGRRTMVPLSRISANLRNATIAMEDKTFYTNPYGVNIEGLLRAAWGEIRGENAGGGSSIPQQVVRNILMTEDERLERIYERKIREIIRTYELTRRYPGIEGRDKILELYLNHIFYGYLAYGVEAAAQTYFGKHVEELSLAECAMLVPLPQSPALNPIDRPEEAEKRQEIVLDSMTLQGYITGEQAYAAKQQRLVIAPPRFDMLAPHYVVYVRDLLLRLQKDKFPDVPVYGGGLQVITSLDLQTQEKAEQIISRNVITLSAKYKANNAAMVVLDVKTAEIRAMVGNVYTTERSISPEVNMAVSPRQPGSSFKPFVYATAFGQGYTPATMVMDIRTSFVDPYSGLPYVPEDYSRKYLGPMLLRRTLANSLNIPAVAMAAKAGMKNVIDTAHAMGITDIREDEEWVGEDGRPYRPYENGYPLALALGAGPVKLLDMAYAFSVFANGGTMLGEPAPSERLRPGYRRLDPVAILKVTNARGDVLYEYKQPQRQDVLRPEVAFLISSILSDNQARSRMFGLDSPLKLQDRPAAAKTGTTNDYRDGWTVGFTPQYATSVWVGNADNVKMVNAEAVRVVAPMWHEMMEWLHQGLPVENFARPQGLEMAIVDSISGKRPTEYSPQSMQEVFIKGTVPIEADDVHIPFKLCKQSGKLATAYCPVEQVEEKVFDIYPPEADDWVRGEQIPQPPQDYCDIHGPSLAATDVAIISPRNLSSVRGVVAINGNAKPGGLERYWLQAGQGMIPDKWLPIGPEHNNGVENNVLENWDTRGLDGLYTLQLSVIAGGNMQQASVQVLVDNISPTVKFAGSMTRPDPFSGGEISIDADAQDNLAMDRVEFFLDDQSLGFSTVAPYSMRWKGTGTHTIYVVAYDAAGNEARSEPIKVHVGG